jgi:hypothetical protein
VALGFISVEFPEFVGTTVKVPDHAAFFGFEVGGDTGRCRWSITHGYIYIRQVIEISQIVRKHVRICAPA